MSALRLGRLPDGTRDVRVCDDGAVGRVTHTRYPIAGGVLVVTASPKSTKEGAYSRRLERCGRWMPVVHEKCYRRIGHGGQCATAAAVARDTERRRRLKYGERVAI